MNNYGDYNDNYYAPQNGYGSTDYGSGHSGQRKEFYEGYQVARIDGKNAFVEIVDRSLGIDKMLINFCRYNGNTKKMEVTISNYLDVSEFLALSQLIKSGALYNKVQRAKERGDQGAVYSKLTGYTPEKAQRMSFPFQVPQGKAVSKVWEVLPSNKNDYYLKSSYRLGTERGGLIVPEGSFLDQVALPVSHIALMGAFLKGEVAIQAYHTIKKMIDQQHYFTS